MFATWDHPDPSGCAVSGGAGWWYGTDCPDTNLHKTFDTSPSASNVAQWINDLDLLEKIGSRVAVRGTIIQQYISPLSGSVVKAYRDLKILITHNPMFLHDLLFGKDLIYIVDLLQRIPLCSTVKTQLQVNVCQHGGTYNDAMSRGDCYDDFTGPYCERRYRGCFEAYNGGRRGGTSKRRIISIRPLNAPREYEVECNLKYERRTLVEKRLQSCQNDYNKTWTEYKTGWTTPCNRWLGLEALYYISNQRIAKFDVSVRGTGTSKGQHHYMNVKIGNETSGYTLTYAGSYMNKHGSGNGFQYELASKHVNGQRFATWDHPDPSGCAVSGGAGWWYGTDCPDTNLHKKFDTSPSASKVAQWPDSNGFLEKVDFLKVYIRVFW